MVVNPSVKIIIVGYNGEECIAGCLQSLQQQDYPRDKYSVTVIDNASQDKTVEIAQGFPGVEVIRNARNVGFASANNIVLKKTESEFVILLNQDSLVEKNFVKELVRVMASDETIGACGAAEHPYNATMKSARKTEETDWIGCGATIIRMSAMKDIGFFDENYFMYDEDIDLSLRLTFSGWKIYYHPKAVWHHKGWGRRVSPSDARVFYSSVSYAYLLLKFASFSQMATVFKKWCVPKNRAVTKGANTARLFEKKTNFVFLISIFLQVLLKIPAAVKNRFVVRKLTYFNQATADALLRKIFDTR